MKYLLDTNTCVHHLRHRAASPVTGKLAGTNAGEVVLCSVVLAELLFGALRSQQVAKNLMEVRQFAAGFLLLPLAAAESEAYAEVRADLAAKGTPIGWNDLLIAAVARANVLTLVTHNTTEFSRVVGLQMEDWLIP